MALVHEFAWSASRASGFSECRRRHYYQYYGGWGGWASSALPERQTMYQLSKLTRMPMVAGDAVHQSLARYLRLRPGHNADESEITDYAVEILRRKFRESRDKEWRRSASKYAHLAEHYYEEPMMQDLPAVAEYGKSFVDRIRTCVHGFFTAPGLAPVRDAQPESYVFVEDDKTAFESFTYHGTKIYGSPDFAYRDTEGTVHLYDWKTGRPSPHDAFQLHVYAVYARQRWDVPIEKFAAYDAYLESGDVVQCPMTRESLAEAEQEIQKSIESMHALHFDADRGLGDAEDFPRIPLDDPRSRTCRRCKFRELCGRTDMD